MGGAGKFRCLVEYRLVEGMGWLSGGRQSTEEVTNWGVNWMGVGGGTI